MRQPGWRLERDMDEKEAAADEVEAGLAAAAGLEEAAEEAEADDEEAADEGRSERSVKLCERV